MQVARKSLMHSGGTDASSTGYIMSRLYCHAYWHSKLTGMQAIELPGGSPDRLGLSWTWPEVARVARGTLRATSRDSAGTLHGDFAIFRDFRLRLVPCDSATVMCINGHILCTNLLSIDSNHGRPAPCALLKYCSNIVSKAAGLGQFGLDNPTSIYYTAMHHGMVRIEQH